LFFLVLSLSSLYAQKSDTSKVKRDTIRNRFLPTGLRIGTDVIALARSNFEPGFKGQELAFDVDFNRYFLAVDYGNWGRTLHGDSGTYTSDGRYWRVGADVNFLSKDPERNMFFIGARYGQSNFSDNYNVTVVDPLWGTLTENYVNTDVSARWYELTGGIKVKIWKFFWMGYTARFKFWLKTDSTPLMLPFDVPGYGRTDKESYWGFNYYVMFRIPFRKMPPLPPAKKKKKPTT
jgi:hypothetical protein